jgi:hypothetical protein
MATKKPTAIAKAKDNRPETGRGGKRNFPSCLPDLSSDEDRALVSRLLTEALVEYRQPKVKSDEELTERINDYYSRCAETGQTPTVEELYLSTGYAISTVKDWEYGRRKGFSPETAAIIKKAKGFMQTFDAKLVVSGKLNFLAYCFRAKNYYGMVDKQEMVLTPNQPQIEGLTPEQLQRKYIEASDFEAK